MSVSILLAVLLCQAAPTPRVTLGAEARVESLRYRFENPSTFDTAELVPHSFEQTYDTDNVWLRLAVRHRVFVAPAEFEAAGSPVMTRRADDFDTFHQPDGNVIVAGTTGNASLHTWTVSERVTTGQWNAVRAGLRYEYRRDVARFHDGDGIVTTTQPPTITHHLVTTRETTTSQMHSLSWVVDGEIHVGSGAVIVRTAAAPLALARLAVELPDKYPGQRLVFDAKVAMVDAEVRYRRALGRWNLGAGVHGQRSFNYSKSAAMYLAGASLVVDVGR